MIIQDECPFSICSDRVVLRRVIGPALYYARQSIDAPSPAPLSFLLLNTDSNRQFPGTCEFWWQRLRRGGGGWSVPPRREEDRGGPRPPKISENTIWFYFFFFFPPQKKTNANQKTFCMPPQLCGVVFEK